MQGNLPVLDMDCVNHAIGNRRIRAIAERSRPFEAAAGDVEAAQQALEKLGVIAKESKE